MADASQEIMWNFSATQAEPPAGSKVADQLWGNPRVDEQSLSAQSAKAMGPTHLTVDLGEVPTVVERGNEPEHWIGPDDEPLGKTAAAVEASMVTVAPRSHDLPRAGAATPMAPVGGCGWAATDNYQRNRVERFINSIGTTQGKPTVTQAVDSKHTLGVGFKATKSGATWSQSGEITRSVSAEASNFLTYSGAVRNRVNYRKYDKVCAFAGKQAEEWRPHSFHSLNYDHVSISRPKWDKAKNCDKVKKNGTLRRSRAGTRSSVRVWSSVALA